MDFANDDERAIWFRGHDDGVSGRRPMLAFIGRHKVRMSHHYNDGWQEGARKRRDGIECQHPGCKSHVTQPCEGCGRQWGKGGNHEGD